MKRYIALALIAVFATAISIYARGTNGDFQVITVKSGENLDSIANKYLKSNRFKDDLLRYNRITAGDVKAGLNVKVPFSISKDRAARIKFLKGTVQRNSGAGWVSVHRSGTVLLQNDVLKTGGNGQVEIQFDDGSLLKLSKNSRISLKQYSYSRKGRKSNINLKSGSLFANVNKLRRKSDFKVSTVTAVAGVRGTQFFVSIDKKEKVKVEVYKGQVDVNAKDKVVSVKSGQQTVVKKGSSPSKPKKIRTKRRVKWAR
ncbi:MAG: FecR domain-containing protein [Spirochaetota bacterium]|nr:FecR domain-containing protein [Spirochaetota bacterium]